MSLYSQDRAEAEASRRRQALAQARAEAGRRQSEVELARTHLEACAAATLLGGDAAAVEEAEVELDQAERAWRRARAAVAGLSG